MFRSLPLNRINSSLAMDWNLETAEIERRRLEFGSNDIAEKQPHRWLELLRDTLADPMIWFLLTASILFAGLGETSDAVVLMLAIIPIGGMDAYLHWRTQVSTRSLSSRLLTYARVMRQQEMSVPARDIVPGDLVVIKAGEYFPADGIIIRALHAQVDESSLTGEAFPIDKTQLTDLPTNNNNPMINREHWGLVGTRLLTGEVMMRVVYTGKETLYGEIIESVLQTSHQKTPLQKAIMSLVTTLIFVAIVFCAILAVVRLNQGFGVFDAILSAATLAIAALPDEYPMVFTFFLGLGVYRLARRNALVRRAVSVENIGRITCICTDKTGTITQGIFSVVDHRVANGVTKEDLFTCAILAARAESGDALDKAILQDLQTHQQQDAICLHVYPFTEERKRETAIYQNKHHLFAVSKGVPEILFPITHLSNEEQHHWREQVVTLAENGYKVIACARLSLQHFDVEAPEPTSQYQFLGLIALSDIPRKEIADAMAYCQLHHIHVLMMTGDHPATAKKIANDIGLGNGAPNVISGDEMEAALKEHGSAFLHKVDAIARAVPAQKYAIVKALQTDGDMVAVTGDGVNDVPALRAADVGIAMGERGTQTAREAASIVLLDDNFGSIVKAIREGKQLFYNMQLSFKYLLMIHIPYVFSATIIPLLGYPLLLYPIHIVWIELFIHPTCLIGFQNLSLRKENIPTSHQHKISFFNRFDWASIMLVGFYTTSVVVGTYLFTLFKTGEADAARANAFLAIGLTHIALTTGLTRLQSLVSRYIIVLSFLMLLFLVQIPYIAHYFNMQPPSLQIWGMLGALSAVTAMLARKFG